MTNKNQLVNLQKFKENGLCRVESNVTSSSTSERKSRKSQPTTQMVFVSIEDDAGDLTYEDVISSPNRDEW